MRKFAYFKHTSSVRNEEHWLHNYYASFNTKLLKKIGKLSDAYCTVLEGKALKSSEAVLQMVAEVKAELKTNSELVNEDNTRLIDFVEGLETRLKETELGKEASSAWDHSKLLKASDALKEEMKQTNPQKFSVGLQLLNDLCDSFDSLLLIRRFDQSTADEVEHFRQEIKEKEGALAHLEKWFGGSVSANFNNLLISFKSILDDKV